MPGLICASSCTASSRSVPGFDRAAAASPQQQADRLTALTEAVRARLLRYLGISSLAQFFLCSSGTDALSTTAMLIERAGGAVTAILPSASETGTKVAMTAMGRVFDGPDGGTPLIECAGKSAETSLRSADGSPRQDEVNNAFAAAATGNVIVFLTHGTKTELIAPTSRPEGANVIVDACRARIELETVAAYLRRGWPVVVTGSRFFGGPAFSEAVFFPRARLPPGGWQHPQRSDLGDAVRLGTALRWSGSARSSRWLPTLRKSSLAGQWPSHRPSRPIWHWCRSMVSQPCALGWADLPGIFIFGLRDPMDCHRLLSATKLWPLYEHVGQAGVLLGQPIGLGPSGGPRLVFGARDLLGPSNRALTRVFAMLEDATALSRRSSWQNPWPARQFQRTSP